MNRPLSTVSFIIEKVVGRMDSHQMTRAHMLYALECMDPKIFNRSEALIMSLKDQLTKCHWGDFEMFGYSAIVVSFFLDRVPLLLPQVALNML